MRAIIYLRVSTQRQRYDGLGLQKQQIMCELEAKRRGIKKQLIFVDVVSGVTKIHNRQQLPQAFIALKKGDVFIVSHRCRLARDADVAVDIKRFLQQTKTPLIIVTEQDHATKSKVLEIALGDYFAQHEREIISARTKEVSKAYQAKNLRFGNIKMGSHLAQDGTHLESCPKELQDIEIAKALHERGLSVGQIIKEMTAAGRGNRNGKSFGKKQIRGMLATSSDTDQEENQTESKSKEELRNLVISLRLQGLSVGQIAREVNKQGFTTKNGNPIMNNQFTRILKTANMITPSTRGVPLGFTVLPNGALAKNPVEQEMMMLVRSLRKQKYSYDDIVQHVTHKKFTTRAGTPYLKNQIVRIVKNEIAM